MRRTALTAMGPSHVLVEVHYSGISTGTEKLLWTGKMPNFPGMGYPLIPGYESVGRIMMPGRRRGAASGNGCLCPVPIAITKRADCSAARRGG